MKPTQQIYLKHIGCLLRLEATKCVLQNECLSFGDRRGMSTLFYLACYLLIFVLCECVIIYQGTPSPQLAHIIICKAEKYYLGGARNILQAHSYILYANWQEFIGEVLAFCTSTICAECPTQW